MVNEYFGKDFQLNNFDILFTSNNDLKINDYKDNLSQAIINRLMTKQGFFKNYPLYGSRLYTLAGKPRITATLIHARNLVYSCLLQEPRVQFIDKIDCEFLDNTTIRIYIKITPINESNSFNIVWDYFMDY